MAGLLVSGRFYLRQPGRVLRCAGRGKQRESGGIGRRTGFRFQRVKPSGFESRLSHHMGRARSSRRETRRSCAVVLRGSMDRRPGTHRYSCSDARRASGQCRLGSRRSTVRGAPTADEDPHATGPDLPDPDLSCRCIACNPVAHHRPFVDIHRRRRLVALAIRQREQRIGTVVDHAATLAAIQLADVRPLTGIARRTRVVPDADAADGSAIVIVDQEAGLDIELPGQGLAVDDREILCLRGTGDATGQFRSPTTRPPGGIFCGIRGRSSRRRKHHQQDHARDNR